MRQRMAAGEVGLWHLDWLRTSLTRKAASVRHYVQVTRTSADNSSNSRAGPAKVRHARKIRDGAGRADHHGVETLTRDVLIRRTSDMFPTGYLTLIAIIQGGAFILELTSSAPIQHFWIHWCRMPSVWVGSCQRCSLQIEFNGGWL